MSKSRLIRVLIANAFEIHFTIQIFYHCLYNNGMIIDNYQKTKNWCLDNYMSSSVQNKFYLNDDQQLLYKLII